MHYEQQPMSSLDTCTQGRVLDGFEMRQLHWAGVGGGKEELESLP